MMIDEVKRARKVGVPLVAIQTPDPWQTVTTLRENINGGAPLVLWDIVRGFKPLNNGAREWLAKLYQSVAPETFTNFVAALAAAEDLPTSNGAPGVLICINAHGLLTDPQPIQGVCNLRNPYKADGRMLILLGPDFKLPPELAQDVVIIDEPLPTPEELATTIDALAAAADAEVSTDDRTRAVDALRGLAAFPAEQTAAMALRPAADKNAKASINLPALWETKRRAISQVRGLTMEPAAETFEQLGGLAQVKDFYQKYFKGRARPRVIVFIDEIEKAMSGAGTGGMGDTSGTSQDALKTLLTEMQDRKYSGALKVGPPGTGKTMIARAVASTYGVPCIALDMGAAKGSLVGQSEAQIRAALKSINAIAGDRGAFFIATCNRLDSLPPELRRRFRAGVWFFDLPDAEERASVARLTARTYEDLDAEKVAEYFRPLAGWSSANIADCIFMANAMRILTSEAAEYIVPAAEQDPRGLAALRAMADGRFLSASKRGKYQAPTGTVDEGPVIETIATAARRVTFAKD